MREKPNPLCSKRQAQVCVCVYARACVRVCMRLKFLRAAWIHYYQSSKQHDKYFVKLHSIKGGTYVRCSHRYMQIQPL
jgi:hypothetical protein